MKYTVEKLLKLRLFTIFSSDAVCVLVCVVVTHVILINTVIAACGPIPLPVLRLRLVAQYHCRVAIAVAAMRIQIMIDMAHVS